MRTRINAKLKQVEDDRQIISTVSKPTKRQVSSKERGLGGYDQSTFFRWLLLTLKEAEALPTLRNEPETR